MNALRVIIAGIVGGMVVFAWNGLAHTKTPLAKMGVDYLPGESLIVSQMKDAMVDPGLYMFPFVDDDFADEARINAQMELMRKGPRGIVVIDPDGTDPSMARFLGIEFATDVGSALIVAAVLSQMRVSRFSRVLFSAVLGIFAWLSVDASNWNWHAYPNDYAIATLAIELVGWLLAGIPIALILGRTAPPPAYAPVTPPPAQPVH